MRASRLISLLLLLQSRGRVTAAGLAAELEVSVRTVYRDIEALQAAGVPLYGEPGHEGGYRLVDGYRTQLTGLNRDEAAALWLMALPTAADDLGLGEAATAAAAKVRASLGQELGRGADAVRQRLHVDPAGWYTEPMGTPFLTRVADAVWRQQRVVVRYRRWQDPPEVERTLEPYGLVLKAGRWYVVARSRAQFRTYRVSQLREVSPVDGHFERLADFDLVAHWAAYLAEFAARRHTEHATLRLSDRGLRRLTHLMEFGVGQAARANASPPDKDGWITTRIPIESIDHAHEEFLRLGGEAEVLAPAALRERLTQTASELTALYAIEASAPSIVDTKATRRPPPR